MKKESARGIIVGAVVMTIVGATISLALGHGRGGSGYGYGMGPGMMGDPGMVGGHGMMGYIGPGMMHGMMGGPGMRGLGHGAVDLSDEQRSKIGQIRRELRKRNWATMGKIMDEREMLFELYSGDPLDAKKIGAVYAKMFDLRRQMIEAGIEARNRMAAVLTPEQREQLQRRHRGRGHGMMGPGMIRPGMGPGMMGG